VNLRFRAPRLRTRILLMFGFGSLALSAFLAAITYNFVRTNLVDQREESAVDQAYDNASRIAADLRSSAPNVQGSLDRLGAERPLLFFRGSWTAGDARFSSAQLPSGMLLDVVEEAVPSKMRLEIADELVVAIGIPLEDVDAAYFEFPTVDDVASTLRSVGLALVFAAGITTLLGIFGGALLASRAIRPVTVASQAAQAIASGQLGTRLEPTDDPDLAALTDSFNDMVVALQARVERDARFTSDVSHELRSPLTTLSTSVEVMLARRDEMPERAQVALDLLVADVDRFRGLVEDLLEISRFDAGAIRLDLEELLVAEFVRQAVAVSTLPRSRVAVDPAAETMVIRADRRRLARVMANLIDNARLHGGGDVEVSVTVPDDGAPPSAVRIMVEDHGPGVPPEERLLIFERFARGGSAGRRSFSDGAGLGLALVDEHVRLHGGRIWLEDRRDGEPGACFAIELAAEELE